jgi:hypothetical protein
MRKTFLLSLPILALMAGIVWSAPAPPDRTLDVQAALDLQPLDQALPLAKTTTSSPCTISCGPDPYDPSAPPITCSSSTGDCHYGGAKGVSWITCDGVSHFCPQL